MRKSSHSAGAPTSPKSNIPTVEMLDNNGLLKQLAKRLMERAMQVELIDLLGYTIEK